MFPVWMIWIGIVGIVLGAFFGWSQTYGKKEEFLPNEPPVWEVNPKYTFVLSFHGTPLPSESTSINGLLLERLEELGFSSVHQSKESRRFEKVITTWPWFPHEVKAIFEVDSAIPGRLTCHVRYNMVPIRDQGELWELSKKIQKDFEPC